MSRGRNARGIQALVLLVTAGGALASWLALRDAREASGPGGPTRGQEIRAARVDVVGAEPVQLPERGRSLEVRQPPPRKGREGASATTENAVLVAHVTEDDGVTPYADENIFVLPYRNDAEGITTLHYLLVDGVTDPNGRAELSVATDVPLRVLVAGTMREVRALGSGERYEIAILLPRQGVVHFYGRVIEAEGGAPIAGAVVETWVLDLAGTRSRHLTPETLTLEDGRELHFESADVQEHYALIRASGYAPGHLVLGLWRRGPDRPAVVALYRAGLLRVQVLGPSEAPEARVLVTLDPPDGLLSRSVRTTVLPGAGSDPWSPWRRYTDLDGRCVFEDLPAGFGMYARLRKGVRNAGIRDPVVLDPGEERDVVWRLGGRVDLRGFVYDEEGEPVSGLALWLDRPREGRPRYFTSNDEDDVFARTMTSHRGGFFFRGIPPGRWAVGPANAERGFVPLGRLVDVPEGAVEHSFTLRVRGGLSIRGVVLDPSGGLRKRVSVKAESVDDGATLTAHSREDGSFTIGPLIPGTYSVRAAGSDPVYAEAGDEDLVLRLQDP